MMYLEDYLEMIEHLPQELRDRFTEMRELDLQVQNSMDILEDRVKLFFCNAKRMKPTDKEMEHEAITKEYLKTLEDADEKVQIANQMYDLVARYARRLDQEALKFKLELEADNIGITEILEKRSHDLDSPSTNSSQKENRYDFPSHRNSHHMDGYGIKKRRDSSTNEHKRIVLNSTAERINLPDIRIASTSAPVVPQIPPTPTPVSYTLGHIGAGGTAIAAAASQAIVATQQMQQGRRTASLKASYEAIHSGNTGPGNCGNPVGPVSGTQEISISKELAGAAQTAIAAIQDTHKKHKKKSSMVSSGTPPISSPVSIPSPSEQSVVPATFERSTEGYDPNEPRYCICNEVAFGTMVACDNRTCPYEWYHYPCVGITDKPKGKWYCPHCTAAMKRRSRKN